VKKTFHIAKANILKNKSASAFLLIIILIVSMLMTIGMSLMLGAEKDYIAGTDRLNSVHSMFIMNRSVYNPSFEDAIREDPRVSQYEIGEVLFPSWVKFNYGGEIELSRVIILNLDNPMKISGPHITAQDLSIPREAAVYLPVFAEQLGLSIGDTYPLTYRNKQIDLAIAGFFETSEFATASDGALKFFVPDECYENLKQHFDSSVYIMARFFDMKNSELFNNDFAAQIDTPLSGFNVVIDANMLMLGFTSGIAMFSVLIMAFAMLIALVSLLVICFRVSNSIENAMHEIGVMKAAGYTSRQIINCYVMEYGIIAMVGALLGLLLSYPVFPAIRQTLAAISGFSWMLGVNNAAGLAVSGFILAILLMMIRSSCKKIKKMPPVQALRAGIATHNFRHNFFPLHEGRGNVHIRLGIKNMFAFLKSYAMIGLVIAGVSLAVCFMTVLYQSLVFDVDGFMKIVGFEAADVTVAAARHTDTDVLAAEIGQMPQVRKTAMLDRVGIDIEGFRSTGYISSDFAQLENMKATEGRFPKHDNEIALPKAFAERLGKKIGNNVKVRTGGFTQEYIITGYFTEISSLGRSGALTLPGYQRIEANYRRASINIYLNRGVTFDEFSALLTQNFGVANVYQQAENSQYAEAKQWAEEKISMYFERYNIDSVEYSVIYNGEIILSGSSSAYQIERIEDYAKLAKASMGSTSSTMALATQLITSVSLVVISLILVMTVRSIVVKRRRELGTLKASGFTTKQLARQLAISFMPLTAVGVVAGCSAGVCVVGPAMRALLSTMGVNGVQFSANPLLIACVGALILLLILFTY